MVITLFTRIPGQSRDLDEGEDKKTLLVGLVAFVNGKPLPLEDEASAGKQKVTVKKRDKGKC